MDAHRWQSIQAAFDTLVELSAAERADRLASLGSSDAELRKAVEALLSADAEASEELAPLEAELPSPGGAEPDPLGLAGQAVAHFQVGEAVGAGGMGVVYRAEDTRLGRAVALKFLLPPYCLDASARARFLREARAAAALDHPNLCAIHEVGASGDGRLFLAMPFYRGETLKVRLARDGRLPVREALAITQQLSEGLESAHGAGIVHRDLKPGNIMLLPDGSVKILDFGLAKARDQSASATGGRFGTVSYMAPEQVRGQSVDGRADLWAVGVVLYEMLTGRKPFVSGEEIGVAHSILHDEPIAPRRLRTDVPPAVEDVVLRLLEKDPVERHANARELIDDLREAEAAAPRSRLSPRARRRVRRIIAARRGPVTAAVGALVVAGAVAYC